MKIACVIGTRPEAIKMASVIRALRPMADVTVMLSGQHPHLVPPLMGELGIGKYRHGVDLSGTDLVVVQGDTNTVADTALGCFRSRIPVAHVEAGLRSFNLHDPFPEEMNRVMSDMCSTMLFPPTKKAYINLLNEDLLPCPVFGNTVIDTLKDHAPAPTYGNYAVLTCHRRESWGEPMAEIFKGVARFCCKHPDFRVVFPVHPNPIVQEAASKLRGFVELVDPMGYKDFTALLAGSRFIISDSGGIQEEACYLGKRVVMTRLTTERPEALEAGITKMVGHNHEVITQTCEQFMDNPEITADRNLYGDGTAGERIAQWICK